MANISCTSCEDLRQTAPSIIVNGFDDDMCTSLGNDTGLVASSGNDDCTDLNNLNDCLIGNQESEVDLYEVCDWKTFMKQFIPNVWTNLKAIICSICGLWTHTHKIECTLNYMTEGYEFKIDEEATGKTKVVPGKGCDFSLRRSSDTWSADVSLEYIAGGSAILTGGLYTFVDDFTDANSNSRSGNSVWDFASNSFTLPIGGELLYEIRISKEEYPEIERFFSSHAFSNGGGQQFFQCKIQRFAPGSWAWGQHGQCSAADGTPYASGYSSGHKVPDGYEYLQVRMFYAVNIPVRSITDGAGATKQGSVFTPTGILGIRLNPNEIDC